MSYPGYPYPNMPGQPGAYPSGGSPYPPGQPQYQPQPGYPAQPQAYPPQAGYPPQPSYPAQPGFPTPSYPSAGGYPSGPAYQAQTGYPSQPQPYPPTTSAYPSSQGYPSMPSQPGYPQNPSYPSVPAANSAYPPTSYPSTPSYPSAAGYAPAAPSAYPSSTYPASYGTPTVRPHPGFDARSDAEMLRKAMKGFGTDEDAIINVLTKRSDQQRQDIVLQYKSLYGKDLADNLKSELSGKLEDLMVAMVLPHYEYFAKEIHHALSFTGYRPESVAEIICSATNEEIRQIKSAYDRMYSRSLEKKIQDDLSGDFKRLLISLCQARRDENPQVNPAATCADAQALYSAGELRWGTDESVFNAILTNRSYPHLAGVFHEYQKITGRDFETAVRSEFSGDIKFGLLAIVKCVRNKHEFFAEQLHDSMVGAGTSDRTLIRLIVSRCEIDLGDIKRAYQAKYGTSLESTIESDTSGDYRRALLSLASS